MRIVIDMQSLQTESRFRGIGRYAFSLISAMLKDDRDIDFWLLLNDQNACDIIRIREMFSGLIDPQKIVTFAAPHAVNEVFPENQWRVRAAELVRSHFVAEMSPDIVFTTSLFEFDVVVSIEPASGRNYKSAVILYDLIPLAEPEVYLQNPLVRQWYDRKLESLCNADLLLAISDYSMTDAIAKLNLDPSKCINISAAADLFAVESIALSNINVGIDSSQVRNDAVLYVGGFDMRKNVDKLIEAYSKLSTDLRNKYPLILAGKIGDTDKQRLLNFAESLGLSPGQIEFTGFTSDDLLVDLYKTCRLFVFPSSSEGFGLPPLEAMHFGAPVIAAARTSLFEVVGSKAALFDPDNISLFTNILEKGLIDNKFREHLICNAAIQTKNFSWFLSASKAFDALLPISATTNLETCISVSKTKTNNAFHTLSEIENRKLKLIHSVAAIKTTSLPTDDELVDVSKNIAENIEFILNRFSSDSQRVMAPFGETTQIDPMNGHSFEENVPLFRHLVAPYAFSSTLCRAQHFRMPLYTYWCNEFREAPRFHRKQWEFVFICQVLFERGYLLPNKQAIGFGVGREPLVSLFASLGVSVLASDLDIENARRLGWVTTNQHSDDQADLNQLNLCATEEFNRLVTFKNIDMNTIPKNLGDFDFCWSSCAFEHLGSIRRGLDFVRNSVRLLKPGGIAVHTTEFNVSSNDRTLDDNESFVIFRRKDIELLVSELRAENFEVEEIDYYAGSEPLEQYVDMPPYQEKLHLRLQLAGEFTSTSIGIIIRKPY